LTEPHVQLILDRDEVPPSLQAALNRLRARVSIRSIAKAMDSGVSDSADVCVVLPGINQSPDALDRILDQGDERACVMMVITPEGITTRRQPGGETADPPSEDTSSPHATADELTGRIRALCEIRRPMRRMQEELVQLKRRDAELTLNAEHYARQLKLAGQIQRGLLPPIPVDTSPLTISTLYLPANDVSGDIYDISQTNDQIFSFSLADATGHGLPTALLTLFVRDIFHGTRCFDENNQPIGPDLLLARLNAELNDTDLTQCQFITAVHAIFDRCAHTIRWARGGTPYPILIRPGQPPRQLQSEGTLIGAYLENEFEIATHHFAQGDTMLFYTDGLEALLMGKTGTDGIVRSDWINEMTTDGIDAAFETIRQHAINRDNWNVDDITVIALTMN